jgi:ABC-type multidrug transport system ATPase subunit
MSSRRLCSTTSISPWRPALALLGPNGAGKTTMVRILATLVRPDTGSATIAGHDLLSDPVGVKRSISLTGQYAAVDDVLTGQENLEMMGQLLRLSRREARARARALLAEFDLDDARDRRVKTYSGGIKRRLDLAISMIERPKLLFLDEPTTGLDLRSREQLRGTVRRLVADGVTVLLTTQYLEEADQLADTVAVLNRGRVVARGAPEQLKAGLGAEMVRLQFADLGTNNAESRYRGQAIGADPGGGIPRRAATCRQRLRWPRERRSSGRSDGVRVAASRLPCLHAWRRRGRRVRR